MDIEVASRAALHEPHAVDDPVRLAREEFNRVRRVELLESRWEQRHPVYAKLLYWPLCGPVLRNRRQRYIERMFRLTVR